MGLLIDENLRPRLVRWACDQGLQAEAVVHVGLPGATDDAVFAHALARDLIVVTVDVGDFMQLAAGMEVHPGVIAFREAGLSAEKQWLRVQSAWRLIKPNGEHDVISLVLEVQAEDVIVWHEIPPR